MNELQSKVVFAPAGSGKTEQLSERYIQLLRQNVPPERILTITFTDKAATEMKERILKKAAETDPKLSQLVRDNILKLRISTIHSFCFSLVRRFAYLLDIDPNPQALTDAESLWSQTKYDTLMKIAEENVDSNEYHLLLDLITTETKQNWDKLSELFNQLFKRRIATLRVTIQNRMAQEICELACQLKEHPVGNDKIDNYHLLFPDNFTPETIEYAYRHLQNHELTFLTKNKDPRRQGFTTEERKWAQLMTRYRWLLLNARAQYQFAKQFWLFREIFLKAYEGMKRELGQVDYDDMELLALKLISQHDEWQNILYAFDERTDHILVDEFQDTSFLQWEIIDKLTEEWRAGAGAKTAKGITPTIFIVGDDKQSIYLFRGANVEVFTRAAERLENWLGKEKFNRTTLKNNYRSLPAIIDFTNTLFSRLMAPEPEQPAWCTRYAPFVCQRTRSGPGRVEIVLHPPEEKINSPESRQIDARIVARRIRALIDNGYQIYERQSNGSETPRPCRYQDIAILIRNRTQLDAIEKALRDYSIPFLVVGGTGFYQEAEIRYLAALTSFLIDPADDIALYITLRSPLFSIKEKDLLVISNAQYPDKDFPPTLWERVSQFATDNHELATAVQILNTALSRVNYEPLHLIVDRILTQTRAWEKFWEPQRAANVKKFLQIIQNMELEGINLYRIKKFLEDSEKDEARADVTISGMDVVQIMTVHAAKGLQFPIVFHPGLNEEILARKSYKEDLIIDETINEQGIVEAQAYYLPDSDVRKSHPVFQTVLEKQIEEEKRVFYVACTRACDALFLTGVWQISTKTDGKEKIKLDWLKKYLGLTFDGKEFKLENANIENVYCINATTIPEPVLPAPEVKEEPKPVVKKGPIQRVTLPQIRSVTRYTPHDHSRHHPEAIVLGDVFHHLFEMFSTRRLAPEDPALKQEIMRLLRQNPIPQDRLDKLMQLVTAQINRIKKSPLWEIIKPQPDSFAELPLMYQDGATLWNCRIDRLIVLPNEVRVYDYKTFPIKETEIPTLTQEYYELQLKHYAAAARSMFPDKKVNVYLVFTSALRIVPVPAEL